MLIDVLFVETNMHLLSASILYTNQIYMCIQTNLLVSACEVNVNSMRK